MNLILASGSPRRRELLAEAGLDFVVRSSEAEEWPVGSMPVAELCETNAELKAGAVADLESDAVVIGADTLVSLDGEALGKPRDLEEAREMLARLAGREQVVCTGVALVFPDGRRERFHETTRVRFRSYGPEVIRAYFDLVDPLDKAGAYGIQESGEMLVESIAGNFDTVMGLPVKALLERLRACGMDVAGIEY